MSSPGNVRAGLWLGLAALLAVRLVASPPQVPKSVLDSLSKPPPMTDQQIVAACTELDGAIRFLTKDPQFSRQPHAAAELRQMQRGLESLKCPGEQAPLEGAWTFTGRPGQTPSMLAGTMTLKHIETAEGEKLAEEAWASFTLRQPCAGQDNFYKGTITWAPDSFYLKEGRWPFMDGKPEVVSFLICGTYGFRGRYRAEPHQNSGGAIQFDSGGTAMTGSFHPFPGPPYSLTFEGKR